MSLWRNALVEIRSYSPKPTHYMVVLSAITVVAMILAIFTLPDWPPFDQVSTTKRLASTAILVSLLALTATLLAIAAGVAEVKLVFPNQALVVRDPEFDLSDRAHPTLRIVIENPTKSSLVNAYQVDIEAIRWGFDGSAKSGFDYRASGLIDGLHADWQDVEFTDRTTAYKWRLRGELLFPGSTIYSPTIGWRGDEYQWIDIVWQVTWWTDRRGPTRSYLVATPPREVEGSNASEVLLRFVRQHHDSPVEEMRDLSGMFLPADRSRPA